MTHFVVSFSARYSACILRRAILPWARSDETRSKLSFASYSSAGHQRRNLSRIIDRNAPGSWLTEFCGKLKSNLRRRSHLAEGQPKPWMDGRPVRARTADLYRVKAMTLDNLLKSGGTGGAFRSCWVT